MVDNIFSEMRTKMIQEVLQLAREKYVNPDMGEKIASGLQKKLEKGSYDQLENEIELANQLTMDLRSISNDFHWSITYDPEGAASSVDPENEPDKERMSRYLDMIRRNNYGFQRVEILPGNIGYLDIRVFIPSEYGGETAAAAMNFLANCDAIIFDVRNNHGGYPSMVQLIISYLVDSEPQLINTFYYRPTNETQQFWTFPHIPGKRLPDIPVYVLTSKETGSGAEEFAYDLKYMKRATLIGETTLGAAHPVTKEVVQGVFDVRLPYGKPINPITGSNWENKGVEPHVSIQADKALETAHLQSLDHLIDNCINESVINDLEWMKEILTSNYSPPEVFEEDLIRCAGKYEKRTFVVDKGDLYYQHEAFPGSWKLVPMSKTRFRLDEDMKFEFIMAESADKASAVGIKYLDGRPGFEVQRSD